jgi:predicted transcriptional regulator of viral defense system
MYNYVQDVESMKSIEITKELRAINKKILSSGDLMKILNSTNKNTIYITIGRLVEKGILRRLSKGLYINVAKPPDKFEIANHLYSPSYVSLESALYRYGIIAQAPYVLTSVTPKKTKRRNAEGTDFEYVHVASKYYFGYHGDNNILIATREKAFLDLLYLIAKKSRRFNLTSIDYKEINRKRLNMYLKSYSFSPLANLLKKLAL